MKSSIHAVAFHPRDKILAAVEYHSGIIRLWNVETGKPIHPREESPEASLNTLAVSRSGRLFATGGDAGVVRIRSLPDAKLVHEFSDHKGPIQSIVISRDDSLVAYSGQGPNHEIRVKNLQSGREKWWLTGHRSHVETLAFNNDGSLLASGSTDGSFRIWSLSNGKVVHELAGSSGQHLSVTFSPDGQLLATGTTNGVKIYNVRTGKDIPVVIPPSADFQSQFSPRRKATRSCRRLSKSYCLGNGYMETQRISVAGNRTDWHRFQP